ncbi:hypothetical protein [Halococcus sp. PRR34]|uniref:hypothetical protein n=1 Tax=Halococcus sp. PRR34 TaxID=3020830 RepID=UPI002362F03A|nr:hypothetical protein [Halococcus sp. PRR34]
MQRNEGTGSSNNTQSTGSFLVDRRSYLKLAGTAAGSAGLLSGTAAGFTRRGIQFDNTVDMVADAGCDPNGNEPCDAEIRDAADDYTLLKFPAGEYKLTEKNYIGDKTNVGFVGEGDVRFTVPSDLNKKVLVVDGGTGLLFENIDLDLRASGATPGLHFGASDDLEIHDVEYIGQGIHPNSDPRGEGDGNPQVTNAFSPIVRSEDGNGTITNVVAKNDGRMGAYNSGDGRVGVWIGISHKGTIRLRNCQFEGFPNNGLYCSRTGGVVQVEGGVFRNNDITQVRLSSDGSYVENAIINADLDNSDSPNPEDTLNTRGVRFEAGRFGFGGAQVRDCDISIVSTTNSNGAVVVGSDGADHTVKNSRISVEEDGIRGFYAAAPTGYGSRDPPPEPHTATVVDTSITGGSNGVEAIRIDQRDDSVVADCCINQTGTDRDGVKMYNSPSNVVKNSTIDVPGQQVLSPGCRVTTRNLSASGSCPVPNKATGDSLPRELSIVSNSGRFRYQLTVSGDLGKSTARGATIDPNDTISGSTATGQGGDGGVDSYGFSGEITQMDVDGDVTVYLDDEVIPQDKYLGNVLSFYGTGSSAEYTFSVSGELSGYEGLNGPDTISGSSATGSVSSGRDRYAFAGEVTDISADGDIDIYLNGNEVTSAELLPNVLEFDGQGQYTSYEFSVSGSLTGYRGINGPDRINGLSASGGVGSGRDIYAFSGEITNIELSGAINVYLNDELIRTGSDHTLKIDGKGSYTTYEFSVSGELDGYKAINGADDIDGSSATGNVGTGRDIYTMGGNIERASLNNRAQIDIDRSAGTISVRGTGEYVSYRVVVTGDISSERGIGYGDEISGNRASGVVTTGVDTYRYTGDIVEATMDEDVSLTVSR